MKQNKIALENFSHKVKLWIFCDCFIAKKYFNLTKLLLLNSNPSVNRSLSSIFSLAENCKLYEIYRKMYILYIEVFLDEKIV